MSWLAGFFSEMEELSTKMDMDIGELSGKNFKNTGLSNHYYANIVCTVSMGCELCAEGSNRNLN